MKRENHALRSLSPVAEISHAPGWNGSNYAGSVQRISSGPSATPT